MPSLDMLRGVAIVLMIVDHAAWVTGVGIHPGSLRMWTRLSMPLFCGLMGFLLAAKDCGCVLPHAGSRPPKDHWAALNWQRWQQILLAAAAVNVFYFPMFGQLEILVSLASAWLIWAGLRSWLSLGAAGFLFYHLDPTAAGTYGWGWFDYPLSLVLPCVAQGYLLRAHGPKVALPVSVVTAATVLLSAVVQFPLIPAPSSYVLIASPIAVAAIHLAVLYPDIRVAGLNWIGRWALTVYTLQYWFFLLIWAARR